MPQTLAETNLIKFEATSKLQIELAISNSKLAASRIMLSERPGQQGTGPPSGGEPATPSAGGTGGPSGLPTPAELYAQFFATTEVVVASSGQ